MKSGLIGGTLFSAALLLSGCGDSPEAMQEQLGSAAPALAFVEADQGPCAGTALMDNIGYDELTAAGYTSGDFVSNPATIEELVTSYDSPELREALSDCIDIDQAFRSELVEQAGGDEAAVDCDHTFSLDEPLVAEYLEVLFDDDLPLEITDSPENRDLLRPCLSEAFFAEQFQIDTAESLAAAIQEALPAEVHALPCAGEAAVEALGAETLNELGVTVETPEISFRQIGISVTERQQFLAAVAPCSEIDVVQREQLRSDEPLFGDCALDRNLDDWKAVALGHELGAPAPSNDLELYYELSNCARDSAEQIIGRELTSSEHNAARGWARSLIPQDEGLASISSTRSMLECSLAVMIGEIGLDEFTDSANAWGYAESEQDFWTAYDSFLRDFYPGRLQCEGAQLFGSLELYRLDFSQQTIDCVHRHVGDVEAMVTALIELYEVGQPTQRQIDDYWLLVDLWQEGIDLCHTTDEDGKVLRLEEIYEAMGEAEEQTF